MLDAEFRDAGDGEVVGVESDEFRVVVDGKAGDDKIEGTGVDSLIAALLAEAGGIAPEVDWGGEKRQGGKLGFDPFLFLCFSPETLLLTFQNASIFPSSRHESLTRIVRRTPPWDGLRRGIDDCRFPWFARFKLLSLVQIRRREHCGCLGPPDFPDFSPPFLFLWSGQRVFQRLAPQKQIISS